MLTKVFNKFGEIQSVKLMLPRNEEERRRRRNCAFIKFATYESAYLAKEALQEKHLLGMGLKLCWGKDIPKQLRALGMLLDYQEYQGLTDTDLEMQYIENQLNMWLKKQAIAKDEELIQRATEMMSQGNVPVTHVVIPALLKDRVVIDKLAKLVSRHGYGAEEDIKDQVARGRIKNATLSKLFNQGMQNSELVAYYKWRVYSFFNGDSKRTWSQLPFQICNNGIVTVPPRNELDKQRLNPAKLIQAKVKKEHALMLGDKLSQSDDEDELPARAPELAHTASSGLHESERTALISYLDRIDC